MVSEEGEQGGAPGTRAEIPLQLVVKTMVRQAVPLQPLEVNSEAEVHLQPVEHPTPEQVDVNKGDCDPVENPHWNRLLTGSEDSWREQPMLDQVCLQDL
ncbi:hypothetical protein llap_11970 [Limosa lapponica baueri]|uniref:Uncharacterized protein n=1 Tax=Limosa lapponica baueri TaxID=1758121 RepID=A0A2I0TVA5_LIMLA|nr:hypothetical protein llap_11970 [Limosa lapponica baueri]